jgi:hypothetical protein
MNRHTRRGTERRSYLSERTLEIKCLAKFAFAALFVRVTGWTAAEATFTTAPRFGLGW